MSDWDRTQGFNRYAYVRNNPLTFTDPTGYQILWGAMSAYEAVGASAWIGFAGSSSIASDLGTWGALIDPAQRFGRQSPRIPGSVTRGFATLRAVVTGLADGYLTAMFGAVLSPARFAGALMSSGDNGSDARDAPGSLGADNTDGEKPPERKANPSKQDSPVWNDLDRAKDGLRTSGSGSKQRYYDWDYTHGDIEVYDRNGRHLGSMEPTTGEMYKPPVPGRKIDKP